LIARTTGVVSATSLVHHERAGPGRWIGDGGIVGDATEGVEVSAHVEESTPLSVLAPGARQRIARLTTDRALGSDETLHAERRAIDHGHESAGVRCIVYPGDPLASLEKRAVTSLHAVIWAGIRTHRRSLVHTHHLVIDITTIAKWTHAVHVLVPVEAPVVAAHASAARPGLVTLLESLGPAFVARERDVGVTGIRQSVAWIGIPLGPVPTRDRQSREDESQGYE
jgi:hypothetical protein